MDILVILKLFIVSVYWYFVPIIPCRSKDIALTAYPLWWYFTVDKIQYSFDADYDVSYPLPVYLLP